MLLRPSSQSVNSSDLVDDTEDSWGSQNNDLSDEDDGEEEEENQEDKEDDTAEEAAVERAGIRQTSARGGPGRGTGREGAKPRKGGNSRSKKD